MKFSSKLPLWQLAFRPFFIFGAIYSVFAIALWVANVSSGLPVLDYFVPMIWHAHEMLYGFTTAIVAGFILTAVQNWTGVRGIHGIKLQVLVALWFTGRILLLLVHTPNGFVAAVDLAFYPMLAFYLAPYLKRPDQKKNRIFILFLALFFTGNLLVHLDSLQIVQDVALKGIFLGVNTTVLVILLIGGRVIPFFTSRVLPGAQLRRYLWLEILSLASVGVFILTQFFMPDTFLVAIIAFCAGAAHFVRLLGWQARRVWKIPILWVLHFAYIWIIAGFFMSGFSALQLIPVSLAVHAFTVGGIGVMIYGMTSRVSLGHTGRPLTPAKSIVVGYFLINAAALIRVFGPIFMLSSYLRVIEISGGLWIVAFFIFVLVYLPILLAPRPDGQVG